MRRAAPIVLCAATFVAFVFGAVPGVDWLDSGELTAAAFALGVSHPPGQPTYTLLGKIATLLPFGEIAFRVSLLSAVTAVLTVAGAIRLSRELIDSDDWRVDVGALLGAALLAVSPMLWEQAVRPEVYAPMAAAAVWGAVFGVRFSRREPRPREALTAALLLALAAGIHPLLAAAIALPFAPAIALRAPRSLLLVAGLGVLGLGVNLLLPMRVDAALSWNDPSSPGGFLDMILGRSYSGNFRLAGTLGRSVQHAALLGEGSGLALLVCGSAGLVFAAVTRLHGALAVVFAGAAVVVGTATQKVFYVENPDIHGYMLSAAPLLVPGIPVLMVAVGRALTGAHRVARALGVAVVAVPVLVMAGTGATKSIDARNRRGDDILPYFDRTLGAVPAGPAVYVTNSDHSLFVNQYEKIVAGARPDVVLAHTGFLTAEWAVRRIKNELPVIYVPYIDDGRRGKMAARLVQGNLARGFPVWSAGPEVGDLWGTPVDGTLDFAFGARRPPGPAPGRPDFPGPMGRRVGGDAVWHRARWEVHAGRYLEALRAVGALDEMSEAERQAVAAIPRDAKPPLLDLPHLSPIFFFEEWQLDAIVRDIRFLAGLPTEPLPPDAGLDLQLLHSWHLLLSGDPAADAEIRNGYVDARASTAIMLLARGRGAEAEAQLRKGIEERPHQVKVAVYLASYLGNQGRIDEAEALLRDVLSRDENPRAMAQLGLIYAKRGRVDEAVKLWRRSIALDPEQTDVEAYLAAAQRGMK